MRGPGPDHALRQVRVLHEAEQHPGAAVERAEPHVAGRGVVVRRAVVHDRETEQVAVERDRPVEIAGDRGEVMQPAELHALLLGHGGQRSRVAGQPARRSYARDEQRDGDAERDQRAGDDRRPRHRGEVEQRRQADRRDPGQHHRVRLVAGEVLTRRGVEAAERAERQPAQEHRAAAVRVEAEQPEDDQHDAREHAQLHQRERVPGRLRALVCQPGNGQPPETLTCHQPISIPSRPARGRTW